MEFWSKKYNEMNCEISIFYDIYKMNTNIWIKKCIKCSEFGFFSNDVLMEIK